VALVLLDNQQDLTGTANQAADDGLLMEAFLCMAEAVDALTKELSLDVIDKIIRNCSATAFAPLKIDSFFVLSILSHARTTPDRHKAARLVFWMAENGRCDTEKLCESDNEAAKIKNGMDGLSLARMIHKRILVDKARVEAQSRASGPVSEKAKEEMQAKDEGLVLAEEHSQGSDQIADEAQESIQAQADGLVQDESQATSSDNPVQAEPQAESPVNTESVSEIESV
jgi:hypothetical protein